MQDKYAGDIGDFGKFILLNEVIRLSHSQFRLGINWYRTTRPEPSSNDGRHISYLLPNTKNNKFSLCDSHIYSKLSSIVNNNRCIQAIEDSNILPPGTLFYSSPLPYGSSDIFNRVVEREAWFQESLNTLKAADIIFLDPDNGVQTPGVKKTQTRSVKYTFIDEIQKYFELCKILIVYNHRDRTPPPQYIQRFFNLLNVFDSSARMKILRFKRVSVRDYLILYKEAQAPLIENLFNILAAAPFDFLFEELRFIVLTAKE